MELAWGVSVVMQAVLVVSLLRANRLDWWTAYLLLDIARSVILWGSSGIQYWAIWTIGLVVLMPIQFMAVQQCITSDGNTDPWVSSWVYGAMALCGWVVALSPSNWPTFRQASMMLWSGCSFACLAVLIGGHCRDWFMLLYYAAHATLSALIQASPAKSWAESIGGAQLVFAVVLFSVWSFDLNRRKIKPNEQ